MARKRRLLPLLEIDYACLRKRRFNSKEECEESIKKSSTKIKLYAYPCPFSIDKNKPHWHKTKHFISGKEEKKEL